MKMFFQKMSRHLVGCMTGMIFLIHLLAISYTFYVNHDVAYFLTAGQMVVHGARPYVDIVDLGPPMILYINSIPALFSQLTKAPLAISGVMFIFFLVIATMFLFVNLLKRIKPDLAQLHIYLLYIAWFFSSLWTYYHQDFGQREHLFFLFLACFLLLRHTRYIQVKVSSWIVIITAVLAFCAVAIKPFYLFVLVLLEVVHIVKYRRLLKPFMTLEVYLCIGFGLLYALHFYAIDGGSFFYDYWLGVVLRGYSAYEIGWQRTLAALLDIRFFVLYFIVTLMLCIVFLKEKESSIFFLSSCFGIFAYTTLILYVWQAKGWSYHLLPFYHSIIIGVVLFWIGIMESMPAKLYQSISTIMAILVVSISHPSLVFLLGAPVPPINKVPFAFPHNTFTEAIELMTTPDDTVLFLSTSIIHAFPALTYAEREHGGRFLCTYPLGFFFHNSSNYEPEEQWKDDEAKFYAWLEEDIRKRQPKLLFINTADHLQATAPYFKISEYLKRKGFYDEISLFYRQIGYVDTFEVYLRYSTDGL